LYKKIKIIKKVYINLLQFIKKYDINRHTIKANTFNNKKRMGDEYL